MGKMSNRKYNEIKLPSAEEYLDIALKDYEGDKAVRARYAKMLALRAARFYIDNQLDSSTVEEDLYNGEDFDCNCEPNDKNKHDATCDDNKYPNLVFSEKEELRDFEALKKLTI